MGARYTPCMRSGTGYDTKGAMFPCPAGITGSGPEVIYYGVSYNPSCYLNNVCNFWNIMNTNAQIYPNQWYRFIIPIFLHGGIIHLAMNLGLQIQCGFMLEKVL
jgi:hypothetical protein